MGFLYICTMSTQEKNELKKASHKEALRYIMNAKEALRKAKKQGNYYQDAKYVRTASGVAYSGMLLALDTYLRTHDIHPAKSGRKSIEWYRDNLRKLDLKLLNEVNTAYNTLHILGYYEGELSVAILHEGMDKAVTVINRIRPTH